MIVTKPAYPLAEISGAAEVLRELLSFACVRIEIAGSIRRQQPTCHDIEIVAIPRLTSITEPATYDHPAAHLDRRARHIRPMGNETAPERIVEHSGAAGTVSLVGAESVEDVHQRWAEACVASQEAPA